MSLMWPYLLEDELQLVEAIGSEKRLSGGLTPLAARPL